MKNLLQIWWAYNRGGLITERDYNRDFTVCRSLLCEGADIKQVKLSDDAINYVIPIEVDINQSTKSNPCERSSA